MLLTTVDLLDQEHLDEIEAEKALMPRPKSHQRIVVASGALLDELLLTIEPVVSAGSPNRRLCHRLRKLVRSLSGRERKAIRFLYFKGLTREEVCVLMKMTSRDLGRTLRGAFAKLRAELMSFS